MRVSEIAGNLQRTFLGFRCLEKESFLQRGRHVGQNQRLTKLALITEIETSEIPGTDNSPMKTVTILRSARQELTFCRQKVNQLEM